MRPLSAFAALLLTAVTAQAQDLTGVDWQLLAINGAPVLENVTASLRIEADGTIQGQAPCNSYGTSNTGSLPEFRPGPIMATKMACDLLAEEVAFFNALSAMERAELEGEGTLILTGPEARSMEFVIDRTTPCTTCTGGQD